MLADGKCGLGFEVEEVTETSAGFSIAVQPVDECTVAMPRTRKDFVKKAAERGIEWDLSDVVEYSGRFYTPIPEIGVLPQLSVSPASHIS